MLAFRADFGGAISLSPYKKTTYVNCRGPFAGNCCGTLPREFLFRATGIWPITGFRPPSPDGEPYVLREVALSAEYSRVRRKLELVDGRWCHVLERPGKDHLWLDVERGCAVMARETYSKETGRMAQRIELGRHREAAPGIWFPMWMRNIQYDHNASKPEHQMRVWKDALHEVLEVRINDVDDSLFEYEPPPGALQIRDNRPPVQVRPGGLDHLDNLACWIAKYGEIEPLRQAGGLQNVTMGVVLALMVILGFEAQRWYRLRRSSR